MTPTKDILKMAEFVLAKRVQCNTDVFLDAGALAENSRLLPLLHQLAERADALEEMNGKLVELVKQWRRSLHDFSPTAVMIDETLKALDGLGK